MQGLLICASNKRSVHKIPVAVGRSVEDDLRLFTAQDAKTMNDDR